jgi:rod shape-determining protein MreC
VQGSNFAERVALRIVGPIQTVTTSLYRSIRDIWQNYFNLVLASRENKKLKQQLAEARAQLNRLKELELSNQRFRALLAFKAHIHHAMVAVEVIGKDPNPWFKSVIIDKGTVDGISPGLPVVMPQGIVGQVIETAARTAKVILITDHNRSVDGLARRTRTRGIIKGGPGGLTVFEYVMRNEEIQIEDEIVSSGLDGVYPKGLPIGRVVAIDQNAAGMFQSVAVLPFVDFEKLEEALVILDPLTLPDGGNEL